MAEKSTGGEPDSPKPGFAQRIVAVVLVAPIAFCIYAYQKWNMGQEFLGVQGGIVPLIVVATVGFSLLATAKGLWTGTPRDKRGE